MIIVIIYELGAIELQHILVLLVITGRKPGGVYWLKPLKKNSELME